MAQSFRSFESWFEKREDVEEALYEGWRQHFCQLWGFVGQQYLADSRYCALSMSMTGDRVLGASKVGKLREKLRRLKGSWRKYLDTKKEEG